MTNLRYQLAEVHCQNCVNKINTALDAEPAVQEHNLNFERSQVSLALDEAKLSRDALKAKFEDLGYPVLQIKEL